MRYNVQSGTAGKADIGRRELLKAGAGAAAGLALGPIVPRRASAAQVPIRLGHLANQSGVYAYLGSYEVKGVQLAVEMVNGAGGVLGRPLELFVEDTGGNPGQAVQKATRLLNRNKVDVLLGTTLSAESFAVGDLAARNKKLFVNTAGNNDGQRCNRYTFSIDHSIRQMANGLGPWLFKNRGKRWYFMTHDTPAANYAYTLMRERLLEHGGTALGNDVVALDVTDFSSFLSKVRAAKPDVLFLSVGGLPLVTLLKQFAELGLRGTMEVSGYTFNQSDAWNMGPDVMTGVWLNLWYYRLDRPGSQEFTKRFTARFQEPPENNSWQGYVGVQSIVKAIEKAGTTSADALVKALETLQFDTLKGRPCYYRDWDHQLMQPAYIGVTRPRDKMADRWDCFELIQEVPGPNEPLDVLGGPKEGAFCQSIGSL